MISNPRLKNITYKSFALAYKKFALPLMKFLVKKTGGDHEAYEEVFSQTIEAGLKSYGAFQHKSTFFTWICKIALNKMADYYRSQIHERSRIVVPTIKEFVKIKSTQLSPEEQLATKELVIAIKSCLALLPPETGRLIYLRYWQELSYKEIAKIVGSTERAVEGKLYRAKQTLKSIFLEKHPDLTPAYLFKH